MRRIDRYILRQTLSPLVFGTIVITLVVWLTQTMQRLELVIENGAGVATFLWLTILIIPSLLVIVLPFAVFGATLFTLQRLHTDSEVSVLFAAGYSKLRLTSPLMLIAIPAAIATLWINVDLMPRCYRELKQQVADIRADMVAMVLRPGEFNKFNDGFTVYVENALKDGAFQGLIVNDYRQPEDQKTYMARYGVFREIDDGPYLLLLDGSIQTFEKEENSANIIMFDQTNVNISSVSPNQNGLQLEITERYLGELFNPDMSNEWDRRNAGRLIAEGHARLASPFFPIAYTLLAAFTLLGGPYSRRGYLTRITLGIGVAAGIKIAALVAQSFAGDHPAFIWTLYALPSIPILILLWLLADGFKGFGKVAKLRKSIRAASSQASQTAGGNAPYLAEKPI
ncbi:MAG: LptF/LptG family permease [Pseudomonadota bacterium]